MVEEAAAVVAVVTLVEDVAAEAVVTEEEAVVARAMRSRRVNALEAVGADSPTRAEEAAEVRTFGLNPGTSAIVKSSRRFFILELP